MKDQIDDLFKTLTPHDDVSKEARIAFDQGYDRIRHRATAQRDTKTRRPYRAVALVAVLCIGFFVSFQTDVIATIDRLFHFGDRGIDQVVNESVEHVPAVSVSDQQVTVSLDRVIGDTHKVALRFSFALAPSQLELVSDATIDFRIRGEDGTFLSEFVPDTKRLYSPNHPFTFADSNVYIDHQAGILTLETLLEAKDGTRASLAGALIQIETIRLIGENGAETIDGMWPFPIQIEGDADVIHYEPTRDVGGIVIHSIQTSETSTWVDLSLDRNFEADENDVFDHVFLRDESGRTYQIETGYRRNGNRLSFHVPYTLHDATTEATLVVEGEGTVPLKRQ